MSARATGDLAGAAGGAPAYVAAMQNDTTTVPTPTTLLEARSPGVPVDEDELAALGRREGA